MLPPINDTVYGQFISWINIQPVNTGAGVQQRSDQGIKLSLLHDILVQVVFTLPRQTSMGSFLNPLYSLSVGKMIFHV